MSEASTPSIHYNTTVWDVKKRIKKECQINIRSVPYIITLTVKSVIIRKFALLSERIGPVSGNTGSERRKRL
jgi:hypothetical protein